jgi:hypothetical protein
VLLLVQVQQPLPEQPVPEALQREPLPERLPQRPDCSALPWQARQSQQSMFLFWYSFFSS